MKDYDTTWKKGLDVHSKRYSITWVRNHVITRETEKSGILTGKVLDLGCGNGVRAFIFKPHCKEILGIDASKFSIDYAQDHFAMDNLIFRVGNILHIPASKKYFDNAYMLGVIEHILDTTQLLREINRVVKGHIFISVTENDYHGDKSHVHVFNKVNLRNVLSEHFKVEKIYVKDRIIFAKAKTK